MADLIKAPPASNLPATTPAQLSVPDLARAINDRMSAMLISFRTSVQRAIEIGELLREAKRRVGHGKFEKWLADHCQLSRASAARYMNLAKKRPEMEKQLADKSLKLRDLNLGMAQRLLSPPQDEESPKKSATERYNKIQQDLLKALLDLDYSDAKGCADRTIGALNNTVEDIKGQG